MIKALEDAISKVRSLPDDKQQLAAQILEELAADRPALLAPDERDAIFEGMAQADEGAFASPAEVEKLLHRRWD